VAKPAYPHYFVLSTLTIFVRIIFFFTASASVSCPGIDPAVLPSHQRRTVPWSTVTLSTHLSRVYSTALSLWSKSFCLVFVPRRPKFAYRIRRGRITFRIFCVKPPAIAAVSLVAPSIFSNLRHFRYCCSRPNILRI
jgi:hypothetical protein